MGSTEGAPRMTEYSLHSPERTKTYVQLDLPGLKKPLIVGLAEQTRPGRFTIWLYDKPTTLEKLATAKTTPGDHHYKRRNDAIWAIKLAYERTLEAASLRTEGVPG